MRMVVAYAPGPSTNDVLGRALAPLLSEALGQNVLVDNKPGAAGTIGTRAVVEAEPDGYTMLMGAGGPIAISPLVMNPPPYDSLKDLQPVTLFAVIPYVISVNPEVPATNIAQLIDYAKARRGKFFFSTSGVGGTPHLCAELLNTTAGLGMIHVAYKGGAPAVLDLMAGRVQLYCGGGITTLAQHQSGKLRILAVTSLQPSVTMPQFPLVANTLPGFSANSWNGIMYPAKTPQSIVRLLHETISAAVKKPEFKALLLKQGVDPVVEGPKEFTAYIEEEMDKWRKVIKSAGLKF